MLNQIVVVLVTAVIATLITLQFSNSGQQPDQAALEQLSTHIASHEAAAPSGSPVSFRFTEELGEDAWLRGKARDGSPRPGPADDAKPIADSANSICYLTKVELTGMDGQEDTTSCKISIDEFTGWWQIHATQGEGTDSSVSCNGRCLVWD